MIFQSQYLLEKNVNIKISKDIIKCYRRLFVSNHNRNRYSNDILPYNLIDILDY